MAKKWTAATLVRQIDTWTQEIYGSSIITDPQVGANIGLGEFVEDVKQAEFNQNLQLPGQQQIRADQAGNVSVADYDAPEDEGVGSPAFDETIRA